MNALGFLRPEAMTYLKENRMSRMRNLSRAGVVLCVGLLLLVCAVPLSGQQAAVASSTSSAAVVPPLVSFSGVLTDLNGKPISGVAGVTFALYKDAQGGAPLWLETQNVYPDKTGHYTVLLGSTTSSGLPPDLFVAGEARWLGVQVQGQAEQPRVSLLSVPYALKAADAQTVGGLPASAFVLAAPPNVNATSAASPSAAVQPMATGTTPVTTAGGTVNKLAKFDATADITSSQVFDNGTNVGIGNTAPGAKLDVSGAAIVRGLLTLPATGTATATAGKNSQPIGWTASAFNSGTATAVNQIFRLQAEPTGNNTATTSGTLNLLYATGTATPAETGLKIASNGRIMFASGQTFPGTGNGSVTSVGTGLGLTGGPITTSGTLAINTTVVPQLKANNSFTGTQSITGSLGINTTAPTQSLEVDSGNAIVRGAANFKTTGNTAFLYIGDTNHPIEAIWNTGLAIGVWKVPQALFIQDQTGNVGVGTTTPAYTLDVHGTGNFTGPVTFVSGQTFPGVPALTGSNTFKGSQTINGNVVIQATGNSLTASGGSTDVSASGSSTGVFGQSGSSAGSGVYGINVASTGGNGVFGYSSPNGNGAGVYGLSTSGSGYGVHGTNTSTAGGYGVYGSGPTGVYGTSSSGNGVVGNSSWTNASAAGVYGNASNQLGVGTFGQNQTESSSGGELFELLGVSPGGVGVWGDGGAIPGSSTTSSNFGVVGTVDTGVAGIFMNFSSAYTLVAANRVGAPFYAVSLLSGRGCNIDDNGNLNCDGSKNAVVSIDGGQRRVALSAIVSPKNWFEDFGSAQLVNGAAVVALDPEFIQTVNTEMDYKVFPVPNGDCKGLYVTNKTATSFEVRELDGGTSNVSFDYRITALRRKYENVRFADHTHDMDPMKAMHERMRSGGVQPQSPNPTKELMPAPDQGSPADPRRGEAQVAKSK
jgi:hypothetical protein